MSTEAQVTPARRTPQRGDPGMWSWVLHRITGAAVFFFVFVHVLNTALVRVSPQVYNEVIETYKTPLMGLLQLGLVACVLFHALNGIRMIVLDAWGRGARHQRPMIWAVAAVWLIVMVPAAVVIGLSITERLR